jgi:O-antigen ligase
MSEKRILIPAAVFLFILPFTHTITLRLTALLITFGVTLWTWRRHHHPVLPLKLPLSLWAGLAILSLLWSVDIWATFKEFRHEIIFSLIAFFSFYALTRSEKELRFFLVTLMLSAAIMAVSGIVSVIHYGTWHAEGYQGGVGTFSTYVVTLLPFVGLYFIIANSWAWRLVAILLFGTLLYSAYLTLNRAVWPALVVELITFYALVVAKSGILSRAYRNGFAIAVVVTAIISVLFFIDVTDQKHGGQRIESIHDALIALEDDNRIPLWRDTMKIIEQRPILGHGFGQNTLKRKSDEVPNLSRLRHAHNIVLNYGLQLGVAGVIVLAILFGALLGSFFKMYRSSDRLAALLGLCAFTMTVGILCKNFTDDFFRRDLALLYWSIAGMSLGYCRWLMFIKSPTGELPVPGR